mmetsp:Transcript_22296/g.45782  ORF Transcript_22296/g.45782 Transcript_22296/m.45782 type:complete len:386 (-) Transcript_22296:169-1326(-)
MTVPNGWNAFVSLHLHVKNEMIFVITVWVSSSLQLRSFVHPEGGSRRCRGRSSRVVIVIRFKSNRSGRRSARAEIGDVVGLLGGSTCSFSILRNGSISGTGSSSTGSSRIDKEGSRGLGLALALVLAMTQFSRCGRRRHRAILRGGHGTGQPRPSSRHDPVVHVPSGVVVHPRQVRLVDARSDRGGSRRGRIEAVARDGQNLRDLHGLEVLLLLLLQLLKRSRFLGTRAMLVAAVVGITMNGPGARFGLTGRGRDVGRMDCRVAVMVGGGWGSPGMDVDVALRLSLTRREVMVVVAGELHGEANGGGRGGQLGGQFESWPGGHVAHGYWMMIAKLRLLDWLGGLDLASLGSLLESSIHLTMTMGLGRSRLAVVRNGIVLDRQRLK